MISNGSLVTFQVDLVGGHTNRNEGPTEHCPLDLEVDLCLISVLNNGASSNLYCVRFAEEHTPNLLEAGLVWQPNTVKGSRENAGRASVSRTLSRLERRGLITRIKGAKSARTLRVNLTNEGRRVAEDVGTH